VVFVGVCYGKKSGLFGKLHMLYKVLNSREVFGLRNAFCPIKCKQYTWAIYDDMGSFFSQRMKPTDFQKHSITFPMLLMDSLLEQARFALEVQRVNFPVAWLEQKVTPKYTGNYKSSGMGVMSVMSPYAGGPADDPKEVKANQDLTVNKRTNHSST
jgi:hypothetical protein